MEEFIGFHLRDLFTLRTLWVIAAKNKSIAAPVVNQATAGLMTETLRVRITESPRGLPAEFRNSARTAVEPGAITVKGMESWVFELAASEKV